MFIQCFLAFYLEHCCRTADEKFEEKANNRKDLRFTDIKTFYNFLKQLFILFAMTNEFLFIFEVKHNVYHNDKKDMGISSVFYYLLLSVEVI